uniref:Uncharacterized protein n=1 Tax=Anguilla anguilla TaxID=7936 RepID=A0A0E9W9I4_ANGAN
MIILHLAHFKIFQPVISGII